MSKESDFGLGKQTEDEISLMFLNTGYWIRSTRCLGTFQGYDLVVAGFNGTELLESKIEIKTDNAVHVTGNIAIEYGRKVNGGIVNAGISASTSDYYIWKLQKSGEILMCRTEALKQLLRDNWNVFERKQGVGRDGLNSIILVPLLSLRTVASGVENFFKINK